MNDKKVNSLNTNEKIQFFSPSQSFSEYEKSQTLREEKRFWGHSFFTNVKVCAEILREEVKPAVTEINRFEFWNKSKLLASFGKSGLRRIPAREQKNWCHFNGKLRYKVTVFYWDLDGNNQAYGYREGRVWISEFIFASTFRNLLKTIRSQN